MKTLARADCAEELVSRLRGIRDDSPRRWGRMSAHQMICHVGDAFRMALGEKTVSDAPLPLPRPLVKLIALYTPLRWRTGFLTRPEIDQEAAGTKPSSFATDVAEAERLLRMVAARPADAGWPRHPAFGRMSHRSWMRWAYLHTDHHLRQFGA